MVFVLILAGALWGLGHLMKAPVQARLYMLGLLYLAVLAVQITLPEGNALRVAVGGSLAEWLVLGVLVVLVIGYRALLARIRARAETVEAGRAGPVVQAGPFTDEELERYARHITLPEIGGTGQRALKQASVLVIGAGGLARP